MRNVIVLQHIQSPYNMDNHLKRLKLSVVPPLLLIFTMAAIEFLKQTLSLDSTVLALHPRHTDGIAGIVTHVMLHSSWRHLAVNSLPLLCLGWCIFYFYKDWAYAILGTTWVLTGILTFIIGRDAWHLGASGLIYGLFSFTFFSGVVNGTKPMIGASLLAVFLYGGMVWGITPYFVKGDVSWEGHLSGFISGMVATLLFHGKSSFAKEAKPQYDDAADEALYEEWVASLNPRHADADKKGENDSKKDAEAKES